MVAKSIAKMYTNIHKPTDYGVMLDDSQLNDVPIIHAHVRQSCKNTPQY